MGLRLVIDLTEDDLEYYGKLLEERCRRGGDLEEHAISQGAREQLERTRRSAGSDLVRARLDDLGELIAMLEDPEWPLETEDRGRIAAALRYFADPMGVIPDCLPGLGLLDDVLMTELILRGLREELSAYRDFCRFREREEERRGEEANVGREDWLAHRRHQLMLRIQRRREERRRHHSTASWTPPILQYRS